jgi:hypothetical protein
METTPMEEAAIIILVKLAYDMPSVKCRDKPHNGNCFPQPVNQILHDWYNRTYYLSPSQYIQVCQETGLTLTQVRNWFANKRARSDPRRKK